MAFSASHSALEGFRLAKRSPLTIVIWAVFSVIYLGIVVALVGGSMGSFVSTVQQMDGMAQPTPEDILRLYGAFFSAFGLAIPVGIVFGSMLYAATIRAVVRPAESAFGYLRFGMDEIRIILTQIVLIVLAALFFGVIGGVFGGLFAVLAVSMGQDNVGALFAGGIVAYIAFFAFVIWISIRFSLVYVITVAERRFAIFDSWGLTKGRFWSLLGMNLLAWILSSVVQTIASFVILPIVFIGISSLGGQEAFNAMEWSEVFQRLAPYAIAVAVLVVLVYALMLAIMYAPAGSAYLGLIEERAQPSRVIDTAPAPDLAPAAAVVTPPSEPPSSPPTA